MGGATRASTANRWENTSRHKAGGPIIDTRMSIGLAVIVATLASTGPQARADLYSTYGDATLTAGPPSDPVVLELTSSQTSGIGYAGIIYQVTSGTLTLNTLTQLSADYEMTTGTVGGGAPRFTIFDQSLNSGYIYWGTPQGGGTFTDPNSGTFANTGNLANATSSDARVALNGFGGVGNGNSYETFAQAQGQVGNVSISYITLDLDAGSFGPTQVMITDHFTVNNNVFNASSLVTPEPSGFVVGLVGTLGFLAYGWRSGNSPGPEAGRGEPA